MIIIPDVHGRSFWKEAVKKKQENEKVIFLGDYLDPYGSEMDIYTEEYIQEDSAIDNFKEILEYAKSNKDDVILLLGNHDTEYFLSTPESRMNYKRADEIKELFMTNLALFNIASYLVLKDITYTFSHSCICKKWVEKNASHFVQDNPTITEVIKRLNNLLHGTIGEFANLGRILGQVGESRWGWCEVGSIVWADVSDLGESEWPGVHQIFGHTQQRQYPIYNKDFSMLDCRTAFRFIPETGEITLLLDKNVEESEIENYNRHGRQED